MLKIHDLVAGYRNIRILNNVSMEIPSNKLCCIVGKNGCGKSTFLKAVDCLISSDGGIFLEDVDLKNLTVKERAKLIAYLPQTRPVPQIHGRLMIEHGRFPHLDFSKRLHEKDIAAVETAIKITNTQDSLNLSLDEMSGGQRQKIYIASALAQETPVLLFDEPTTHLDLPNQIEILELLSKLKENKTIITVLHDIVEAFSFGDYILVMDEGRIVAEGVPEQVYSNACIQSIFGASLAPDDNFNSFFKYKLIKNL